MDKKRDFNMKDISRHEPSIRMSKAVVFNETAYLCGQVNAGNNA